MLTASPLGPVTSMVKSEQHAAAACLQKSTAGRRRCRPGEIRPQRAVSRKAPASGPLERNQVARKPSAEIDNSRLRVVLASQSRVHRPHPIGWRRLASFSNHQRNLLKRPRHCGPCQLKVGVLALVKNSQCHYTFSFWSPGPVRAWSMRSCRRIQPGAAQTSPYLGLTNGPKSFRRLAPIPVRFLTSIVRPLQDIESSVRYAKIGRFSSIPARTYPRTEPNCVQSQRVPARTPPARHRQRARRAARHRSERRRRSSRRAIGPRRARCPSSRRRRRSIPLTR